MLAAEEERVHILHRDILGGPDIRLHAMPAEHARRELAAFTAALWRVPHMEGYFDRRHLAHLQEHVHEARHGFARLKQGGIIEVVAIPALPEDVMGFHIYTVFDPNDDTDKGRHIGYAVYSLERGQAPFGQAEAVRLAFDIFPEYREGRYTKVPFTNHEVYNLTRKVLFTYKPKWFLVDAKTQIKQTRTGNPIKRTIYYIKRGYYPPDQKLAADKILVRLGRGQRVGVRSVQALLKATQAAFWIYPAVRYLRKTKRLLDRLEQAD